MGALLARRQEEQSEYDQARNRAAHILAECQPDYVSDAELLGLAPADKTHDEFEAPESEEEENEDDDDDGKMDALGLKAKVKEEMKRDNLALIKAAAAGRYFAVMQLLSRQHVFVDFEDKHKRTPLHMAAERGQSQTLERLVNAKANVHHKNNDLWTPLHAATFAGQANLMADLLQHQANVNDQDRTGCTPLFFAVSSPKIFLVDLVSKADRIKRRRYRAQTYRKQMALEGQKTKRMADTPDAAWVGGLPSLDDPTTRWERFPNRIELICMDKLLNKFGVIVDACDKRNRTPLMYAARYGRDVALSRLLAARASPTRVDRDGRSALFYAAMSGHTVVAKMLIEIGGQVNKQDAYFQTPLHCAMTNTDEALTNLLLKAEASVNAYDCEGRTPIMLAMDSMNRRLFADLVQRGSNLDVVDRRGWNVVIYSINTVMFAEVLTVLQRTGERAQTILNYQDPQGFCALHHAVQLPNLEVSNRIVAQLVQLHPEAAAMPDCNGNTPVHMAAQLGRLEALRILIDGLPNAELRNNRGDTPLLFAAHAGHIDCVLTLLHDSGDGAMADANARDIDGHTLLMHACSSGHLDLVNILIENREGHHTELAIPSFDVNVAANDGMTALMLAAQNGHWQLLPSLVLGGANMTAKDNDGFSALHFAACDDEGLAIRCLIDLSMYIDAKDADGWTALMHACDLGCNEAARVLLDSKADLDARNSDGDTALQICSKRQDSEAVHTRNILMDAMYERHERCTLGVAAQGCFLVSILDASELFLEGAAGEINPYVCLQFCSHKGAIPQTSFTTCAIKDPSPTWHEVFRFDTEHIDTSAYLVAWLMNAPGADEEDILEAAALGVNAEELKQIQTRVDTRSLRKPDYQNGLSKMLKRVRRRAEMQEDLEVERLRVLATAKDGGMQSTEDAKGLNSSVGESLEKRRWQELKNLRDMLAVTGCNVPRPIAPSAHLPLGCVVLRFRHLRQAVWSTVPVQIDRMVRLSRRGTLRLEVDFRPRFFGCAIQNPELTVEEEESLYECDEHLLDADVELKLLEDERPHEEVLPVRHVDAKPGSVLISEPQQLYKRFMQIAVHSKKAIQVHEEMGVELKRKSKAKAARQGATVNRFAFAKNQLAKGAEWARQKNAARIERRQGMDRPFKESASAPAVTSAKTDSKTSEMTSYFSEPWLEEFLGGSRFV